MVVDDKPFSGSYADDDVAFLLARVQVPDTPVAEKEALIQSGQKHYSQLLSKESLPPETYQALFQQALTENKSVVAKHVLALAKHIIATRPHGVTLVSLARAGTPVGVMVKKVLAEYFHVNAKHYSVSIIRDIGLDLNALRYILARHAPESLVFIDGWTGKGVIARQLQRSLEVFAESEGVVIPPALYVLADLSGSAAYAASTEDYLIPSCILNATVSGLASRSLYDAHLVAEQGFHACVYYDEFSPYDVSRYFVEQVLACIEPDWLNAKQLVSLDLVAAQERMQRLLTMVTQHYQVSHVNFIKPGIGEATRVLLRREARVLLLKNAADPTTQHLRWLAEEKSVPIYYYAELEYHAVALIKELF